MRGKSTPFFFNITKQSFSILLNILHFRLNFLNVSLHNFTGHNKSNFIVSNSFHLSQAILDALRAIWTEFFGLNITPNLKVVSDQKSGFKTKPAWMKTTTAALGEEVIGMQSLSPTWFQAGPRMFKTISPTCVDYATPRQESKYGSILTILLPSQKPMKPLWTNWLWRQNPVTQARW